jgi:DNA mismatch repair protein MutL
MHVFERHALHQKSVRRKIYFCIPRFRGEALASIAAIAHVEMKTKQDQEELGTKIVVEGSVCVTRGSRFTKGTSFAVKTCFSTSQLAVLKVRYGRVSSYR